MRTIYNKYYENEDYFKHLAKNEDIRNKNYKNENKKVFKPYINYFVHLSLIIII